MRSNFLLLLRSEALVLLLNFSFFSNLINAFKVAKLSVGACLTCSAPCKRASNFLRGNIFSFLRIYYLTFLFRQGRNLVFAEGGFVPAHLLYRAKSTLPVAIIPKRVVVAVSDRGRDERNLAFPVSSLCSRRTNQSFILCFQIFYLSSVV